MLEQLTLLELLRISCWGLAFVSPLFFAFGAGDVLDGEESVESARALLFAAMFFQVVALFAAYSAGLHG